MRTVRLTFILCVLGFILSRAVPQAAAERVKLELKDGRIVAGELLEFSEDRKYHIRTDSGELEIVDESKVKGLLPPEAETARLFGPDKAEVLAGSAVEDVGEGLPPVFSVPTNPEAAKALDEGLNLEDQGKIAEALQCYKRGYEIDPWCAGLRFLVTRAYLKAGLLDEAQAEVDKIVNVEPKNIYARELLCRILAKRNLPEKANAERERLIRMRFPKGEADYRIAHFWLAKADFRRAAEFWKLYLAADQNMLASYNSEAVMIREAEGFLAVSAFESAIDALYLAKERNPLLADNILKRVIDAHEKAASYHSTGGNFEKAIDEYVQLTELAPDSRSKYVDALKAALFDQLVSLVQGGKTEALAKQMTCPAAELAPEETEDVLNRFADWINSGITRNAADPGLFAATLALKDAATNLAVKPSKRMIENLSGLFLRLAEHRFSRKAYDEAVLQLENAAGLCPTLMPEVSPKMAACYREMGVARIAAGDFKTAAQMLEKAVKLQPGDNVAKEKLELARFEMVKICLQQEPDVNKQLAILHEYLKDPARPAQNVEWAKETTDSLTAKLKHLTAKAIEETRKYYPLSVGSWWKYRRSDGAEITVKVVSSKIENDTAVIDFTAVTVLAGHASSQSYAIYNNVFELYAIQGKYKDVRMRLPINVGLSWESRMSSMVFKHTYEARDGVVDVAAGHFEECLVVESRASLSIAGEPSTETVTCSYIAPGIGLVKVEALSPESIAGRVNQELVSYYIDK